MPSWTAGLLAALALPLVLPIALGARLSRAGVARVQPLRAPSARHAMAAVSYTHLTLPATPYV